MSDARRQAPGTGPELCVLVPVTECPQPLQDLFREFSEPLARAGLSYEFVFIVDGLAPDLVKPLYDLRDAGEPVRVLLSTHAPPEAAVAQVGRAHTSASTFVTLPSYPRVVADALVALVRALDDGYDMVTAARVNADDPAVNRLQRRLFHFLLGKMVGGPFRDIACGVRAMRRVVIEELDLYGDFFRFVPMLALRDGFRVHELPVSAHPGDRRTRVYSPGIYLRRLVDLVGLMLLVRFTYKPLRFFGLVGSGLAGVGGVILVVLLVQRLGGRGIADRPMLLLGVLLVVVGLQAISLGLVGEIVVHHNVAKRPLYRVADTGAQPQASREPSVGPAGALEPAPESHASVVTPAGRGPTGEEE